MELPANPAALQFGAYSGTYFDNPNHNKVQTTWQLADPEDQPMEAPIYFDIY